MTSIVNGVNNTLAKIKDTTYALDVLEIVGVASAVNQATLTNAATGNSPTLSATGTDTNIALTLSGKGTGGVPLKGVTSGSNVATGYVGEILSSIVNYNGVNLSTATPANLTSLSLTAGIWLVDGYAIFAAAGSTTVSFLAAGIGATSATLPNILAPIISEPSVRFSETFSTGGSNVLPISRAFINLNATTTYYLVGQANFAVSSMTAGCVMLAQRIA